MIATRKSPSKGPKRPKFGSQCGRADQAVFFQAVALGMRVLFPVPTDIVGGSYLVLIDQNEMDFMCVLMEGRDDGGASWKIEGGHRVLSEASGQRICRGIPCEAIVSYRHFT